MKASPKLPNARNDADATAQMLADAHFDVRRAMDASLPNLRAAVERFADAVESAGSGSVAVVYYAGHAIQRHGNNHLLPIDVKPTTEEDIPAQTVTLGEILKRLDGAGVGTKILILDACRDNPFPDSLAQTRGLAVALLDNPGKAEAGLARVESKGGTFVAFSTSPGTAAADGAGQHSPFTEAFLQYAREPGLPVEAVFRKVRMSVHDATSGGQIPWETSSLTAAFTFFDSGETAPSLSLASAETGRAGGVDRTGLGPKPTRESLKALPASEAYNQVVAWDMPETYRLFLDVYGEDVLALRVHRILGTRLEEMSWAMAARWGDPAHLRRYAAVFEGSIHATEARAMAAAGGAPSAKICTPAMPNGGIAPAAPPAPSAPILRKANLKQPAKKNAAVSPPPAPRGGRHGRPVEAALEDEGEPYDLPTAVAPLFNPGLVLGGPHRGAYPVPPMGRGSHANPPGFSPEFKRFIDAGRSNPPYAAAPMRASPPVVRGIPSGPILRPGYGGPTTRPGLLPARPVLSIPGGGRPVLSPFTSGGGMAIR